MDHNFFNSYAPYHTCKYLLSSINMMSRHRQVGSMFSETFPVSLGCGNRTVAVKIRWMDSLPKFRLDWIQEFTRSECSSFMFFSLDGQIKPGTEFQKLKYFIAILESLFLISTCFFTNVVPTNGGLFSWCHAFRQLLFRVVACRVPIRTVCLWWV